MEELLWKSEANSMLSSTIGRVMNTILSSRPRKLEDAISRVDSSSGSQRGSGVSLDESLWFLQKYVRDAVESREPLDQILVPMIENSLKCKDSKHYNQVLILLNWFFQDELLFQALATNLAEIITRKEDRYIALGWCTLICGLVDYEITMSHCSNSGIREKYRTLLKILCPSISHLSSIICGGSTLQDGFELPTRLSVAAADCTLVLTEALTKKALISDGSSYREKSSGPDRANRGIALVPAASCEKTVKSTYRSPDASDDVEMDFLLWDHLDELIILVQKLLAWSRKSRPLHAKGLEQVWKWLKEIKGHHGSLQDEAGAGILKTGVLLLSSCWKHFAVLLLLEDRKLSQHYKESLNQYISGIQFYMDDYTDKYSGNKDSGIETRKFFLNCLSLLLGRLDSKQFEIAMSEYGLQISNLLLSQLQCGDEYVIDGALCILRATIFKTNHPSTRSSLLDTRQINAVLPLLLNLLDERDSTARAVVLFIAEFCSINTDGHCLQEVLKRLASGRLLQRRNAIDVISELIHMSSDSAKLPPLMWQDIANHLLERLGDEELVIRKQASNLFPMIDPPLVLPALVHLVYSPDERVQSSASDAVITVLQYHNHNLEVIYMLLDCLSNLCQGLDHSKTPGEIGEGSKLDTDRVLRLIPEWSKSVQDWNVLIEPLIEKMFVEPSNATIVRFLSYISEHLAEAADVVLHRVLLYMKGQKEMDENLFSRRECGTNTSDVSVELQHSLFDRLCPLLIIRMLPLRVFNDLNSSVLYGQLLSQDIMHDNRDFNINNNECVAAVLLNRAFHKFEFEDVRKLAAELCGRIHPQVLFPIIWSQLEHATHSQDILQIKACLFSVCTSLVVRGGWLALPPIMLNMRKLLEVVLLWPSLDGDEVSKAQHGCIDCLALMICAELQAPESSKDSTWDKISIVREENGSPADVSILTYVIHRLTQDKIECVPITQLGCKSFTEDKSPDSGHASEQLIPLSFRLCMANVLISACQKISSSSKNPFAQRTVPDLIHSVKVIRDSEIRAACIQVLFSAVYHLKSAVLPYSSDLLKLSVKALQKGSEKERMAGAKLMASLMASEDAVVESISRGLLEARSVLLSISLIDPSLQLRQVCEKLLACITSP